MLLNDFNSRIQAARAAQSAEADRTSPPMNMPVDKSLPATDEAAKVPPLPSAPPLPETGLTDKPLSSEKPMPDPSAPPMPPETAAEMAALQAKYAEAMKRLAEAESSLAEMKEKEDVPVPSAPPSTMMVLPKTDLEAAGADRILLLKGVIENHRLSAPEQMSVWDEGGFTYNESKQEWLFKGGYTSISVSKSGDKISFDCHPDDERIKVVQHVLGTDNPVYIKTNNFIQFRKTAVALFKNDFRLKQNLVRSFVNPKPHTLAAEQRRMLVGSLKAIRLGYAEDDIEVTKGQMQFDEDVERFLGEAGKVLLAEITMVVSSDAESASVSSSGSGSGAEERAAGSSAMLVAPGSPASPIAVTSPAACAE